MDFDKLEKLVVIRSVIEEVDSLRQKGVEVDEDGAIKAKMLKEASDIAGYKISSYEDLKTFTGGAEPPPTFWDRAKGFVTFGNIVLVFAAIMGVAAVCFLFGHYFIALILAVPLPAWEVICYCACFGLIAAGTKVEPDYLLMPVLPGVLGLIGCTFLTDRAHFHKNEERRSRRYSDVSNQYLQLIQWGFLAIAWGAVAVFYSSQLIGFLSVMAAMTAVGFVCGVMPWGVYVGWDDDKMIPRGITAGFIALLFYVVTHITGLSSPAIDVFKPGAHFMGAFVYFLGMLIMSAKWYDGINGKYLLMNGLTIVSGVAALYLGSVFGMGTLLGVGGTLFFLYVLEKYFELPWEGVGWIWAMLFLAIGLYFAVGQMKAHSEYFLLF
jgi:hypothetical protein